MGRKPTPQPLMLAEPDSPLDHLAEGEPAAVAETSAQGPSPVGPRSPVSLRSSPFASRFGPKRSQPGRSALQPAVDLNQQHHQPQSPPPDNPPAATLQSIPPASAPSPATSAHRTRGHHASTDSKKSSKSGFFHFSKASKGSNQLLVPSTQQQHDSRDHLTSSGSDGAAVAKRGDSPYAHDARDKPPAQYPSRSDLSLSSTGDHDAAATPSPGKISKPKPFSRLAHPRSVTENRDYGSPRTSTAALHAASSRTELYETTSPKTAPLGQDHYFPEMMSSTVRNRSEDRAPSRDMASAKESSRDRDQRAHSAPRDNGGSNFFSGLRSSSTKAADMISKGLFGKGPRSGSGSERDSTFDDEQYSLKVINLPLVEQTRLTRISKRLPSSRDKTEFWMPAFPWRAIDYLNYKGCDVEGLYRVPGSGPQVKKWQRKFDEQYDVNLFEEEGLYDINIIGSMLKAWLRELPDELFPKEAQDRISRECAGSTEVPQILVDELSNLSPFNYYLLFAITCHLSLLLAHSDKNKMDFRNLCICFQPCMKIDAFCFKFLVCDWRDCWKGCKNEAKYIEEEYVLFDQPPPRGLADPQQPTKPEKIVERPSTSPETRQKAAVGNDGRKALPKKSRLYPSDSKASVDSDASSVSTSLSTHSDRNVGDRNVSDRLVSDRNISDRSINDRNGPDGASRNIRPLSPIKPLSPLGF
ncbi:hypothetical protein HIM_00433 [Hirsutella minnesotensis 3608]|nr:hypothetical protein HIM_00433 [Hirsutella minnesotensis 3608]